jgi:hypothetical protein
MAGGRRTLVMTGTLAVVGAAGGGVAGYLLAPDIPGVIASLALAGFGLGGAIGVIFGGGWRKPKPLVEAAPQPEPAPVVEEPEPPPPPPPPEGEEPGWYTVPDGTKRFWDGEQWTAHVWRERLSREPRAASRRTRHR